MSNEMNLYKRCKNIFKSHGVDMGGGGSGGEGVTIVHITATVNEDESVDITADVAAERALEILKAGGIVSVIVERSMPDDPEFNLTMALGPAVFCADAPESPYLWVYYDGMSGGFRPIVGIENGEWVTIN